MHTLICCKNTLECITSSYVRVNVECIDGANATYRKLKEMLEVSFTENRAIYINKNISYKIVYLKYHSCKRIYMCHMAGIDTRSILS